MLSIENYMHLSKYSIDNYKYHMWIKKGFHNSRYYTYIHRIFMLRHWLLTPHNIYGQLLHKSHKNTIILLDKLNTYNNIFNSSQFQYHNTFINKYK